MVLNALYMCLLHSWFIENHPILILEDGSLISEVVLSQSDESSKSDGDDLSTIAIKGESSSSKSLFPKLSKHTCLMAKESKKKAKSNTPSSPKYVTSDDDTLFY
jgi:hypothetical protein